MSKKIIKLGAEMYEWKGPKEATESNKSRGRGSLLLEKPEM